MSKKKKPSGWPRAAVARPEQRKHDTIRQITNRLLSRSVSEESKRFAIRRTEMLSAWQEFRLVLPDTEELEDTLEQLPERERQVLLGGPGTSSHAARRARAKLYAELFDESCIEEFTRALDHAITRASSRDELGAIAFGFFGLSLYAHDAVPPESNPLLGLFALATLKGMVDLDHAIGDLKQRTTGATGQPHADPESDQSMRETIQRHPLLQAEFERRMARRSRLLFSWIQCGVIQPHVTADEFAPVLPEVKRMAGTPATATQPEDESAAAERTDEIMAMLRTFAEDPANTRAFERFAAELEAQAKEAESTGLSEARRLRRLADFCRNSIDHPFLRTLIAQASALRLLQSVGAGWPGASQIQRDRP